MPIAEKASTFAERLQSVACGWGLQQFGARFKAKLTSNRARRARVVARQHDSSDAAIGQPLDAVRCVFARFVTERDKPVDCPAGSKQHDGLTLTFEGSEAFCQIRCDRRLLGGISRRADRREAALQTRRHGLARDRHAATEYGWQLKASCLRDLDDSAPKGMAGIALDGRSFGKDVISSLLIAMTSVTCGRPLSPTAGSSMRYRREVKEAARPEALQVTDCDSSPDDRKLC